MMSLENPIYNNDKEVKKSREEIIKYERYNTRLEIIVENQNNGSQNLDSSHQ